MDEEIQCEENISGKNVGIQCEQKEMKEVSTNTTLVELVDEEFQCEEKISGKENQSKIQFNIDNYNAFETDYVDFKKHVFYELGNIKDTISKIQSSDLLTHDTEKSPEIGILKNLEDISKENTILQAEVDRLNKLLELGILKNIPDHSNIQPDESYHSGCSSSHDVTEHQTHVFVTPKKTVKVSNCDILGKIPLRNRFSNLAFHNNNQWLCDDQGDFASMVNVEKSVRCSPISSAYLHRQKNRPPVVVEANPERNVILSHRNIKTVPGNSLFSGMVSNGKQIGIFGDSMIKRILGQRISKDMDNGKVRVKPFLGATAKEVEHHLKPEMEKTHYDSVIICAGTNNVPPTKKHNSDIWTEQTPDEIAQEIINVGFYCREQGVNDIYISLLTVRKTFVEKINKINNLLKDYCRASHFYFIDHSNLKLEHLYDGTHIDTKFLHLYANNMSNMLNIT